MSSTVSLPKHNWEGLVLYFFKWSTSIVHILSPETDKVPFSKRERMTIFHAQSPQKKMMPTAGVESPDHQSDAHLAEPPRQAQPDQVI